MPYEDSLANDFFFINYDYEQHKQITQPKDLLFTIQNGEMIGKMC